jgi:hypothetical protein
MALTTSNLLQAAQIVRGIHVSYTRKPNEGDLSRVLAGYLAGCSGTGKAPNREAPQPYVTPTGKKVKGRIDFLQGSKSNGTFIELAIIREGELWSFKQKIFSGPLETRTRWRQASPPVSNNH